MFGFLQLRRSDLSIEAAGVFWVLAAPEERPVYKAAGVFWVRAAPEERPVYRTGWRCSVFAAPEERPGGALANTFTQIYIHIVFAVNGRQCLITKQFKEELYKYIAGIIRNENQKLIAINGMSDHLHVLVGLKPEMAISGLVREIKSSSSNFINSKRWVKGRFSWQQGFGAFSYSHSQLGSVARYIENQETHHAERSFKEEYLALLRKFDIAYDTKYLFNWMEDE